MKEKTRISLLSLISKEIYACAKRLMQFILNAYSVGCLYDLMLNRQLSISRK